MGLRAENSKWEFPGGKVDDEPVEAAARREQKEESGMVLKGAPTVLGYLEVQSDKPGRQRYFEVIFGWREWSGFPQRLEEDKCLAWRWFPVDDLPAMDACCKGTQDVIRSLLPAYLASLETKMETV